MEDKKSTNEIFAEALIRILDNQVKIKKHLGLVKDEGYYGDCYYDEMIMENLRTVE